MWALFQRAVKSVHTSKLPAKPFSCPSCTFKCDYILTLFPCEGSFWGAFYLKRPCGVERTFPVGGPSSLSASPGPWGWEAEPILILPLCLGPSHSHKNPKSQQCGEIQLRPDVHVWRWTFLLNGRWKDGHLETARREQTVVDCGRAEGQAAGGLGALDTPRPVSVTRGPVW